MKLEGETAFFHSNLVQNPKSESFHHNDSTTEAVDQKSSKETLRKCKDDELFFETKCNKKAVSLAADGNNVGIFWPVSRFDRSESVSSIKGGNESGSTDSMVSSSDSFGETESLKEEVDLFTDKNMTQCELPEVKLCSRDLSEPDVRDICVDDSGPPEKILFQTCGDSGFETSPIEKTVDCNLAEEDSKTNVSSVDIEDNSAKQYCSVHPVKDNSSAVMVTDDVSIGKSVPLVQMMSPEHQHKDSTDAAIDDTKVGHESVVGDSGSSCAFEAIENSCKSLVSTCQLTESTNEKQVNCVANIPKSHEAESGGPNEEATAEKSLSVEQSSDGDNSNAISYSSQVESGSITFNFDASAPSSSGREEGNPNASNVNGETHVKSTSKDEEGCDSRADSYRYQHSHGETSFTMAGPVSGSITYSGPIAYSGSLSLRSEGSAASTRSFAFPILQSEWNSSPVRMKKADKRGRGGWRQGFLCCKF